ncbi:MAG: hypothetical protein U0R49_00150 [Fimbriimonadales bacterium]
MSAQLSEEEIAARRATRLRLIAESEVVARPFLAELNKKFGLSLEKYTDLTRAQLSPQLLDVLLRQYEQCGNDLLRWDLNSVIAQSNHRIDADPLIHSFANVSEPLLRFELRCTILDTLSRVKTKQDISIWLTDLLSRPIGEQLGGAIFFALAKHLRSEDAERLIREHFWESPGIAAECLSKIGNAETAQFLASRLEEFDAKTKDWDPSWERSWHTKRITRSIRAIQNRIARKLDREEREM